MRTFFLRTAKLLPALAVVAVFAVPSQAAILMNSSFEAGTGTDADIWNEVVAGPHGTVERVNTSAQDGTWAARMAYTNPATGAAGGAYFIEQNLGANTIDNTLLHDLSFWARSENTNFVGVNMFVQLQWLDQDNSNGGGFKGQLEQSLTGSLTTTYQEFSFTNLVVPADADSFLLRFQASAGAVDGISNALYVDNASLSAVPEPGSAALLSGLGLIGVLVRRRRA